MVSGHKLCARESLKKYYMLKLFMQFLQLNFLIRRGIIFNRFASLRFKAALFLPCVSMCIYKLIISYHLQ